MERKLTGKEKEAIRNSFCWRCGAVPPFADGSRCHPHRVIHGCDGGEYVIGNVVARCPPCHDKEHGGTGNPPLIGAASTALPQHRRTEVGRKGARALWDKMNPKQRKAFVKTPATARTNSMTSTQRRELSQKAAKARHALPEKEKRRIGQKISKAQLSNPKLIASRRRNMRKVGRLPKDPKICSAAGIKGTHLRWHIRRGIISQDCTLCTKGG